MPFPLSMKNILIIDDDKFFRLNLAKALGRCKKDLVIITAENGKEAVKMMDEFPADIIITDLNMPEMDGYEFLSFARKNFPHIPVFVISGLKTPAVMERLRSIGISRCIEKPFDIGKMVNMIFE
ncbi:MAG: response regulator [Nitrospirae bacterium]|nr:response regulator [Nitrospirota bacterium]